MIPQAMDGKPTGRLNENNMEIEIYVIDGQGTKVNCGTRWVPITPEQRKQIMGQNNAVVSMGADISKVEIARSTNVTVDVSGRATFSKRHDSDPPMKACVGTADRVDRMGNYMPEEELKRFFVEAVPKRAEELQRIAALDAQLFKPLTGHLNPAPVGFRMLSRAEIDAIAKRQSKWDEPTKPVREIRDLSITSFDMMSDGTIQPRGFILSEEQKKRMTAGLNKQPVRHAAAMHPDGVEYPGQVHPTSAELNTPLVPGVSVPGEIKTPGTYPAFTMNADNTITDHRAPGQVKKENSGGNVSYYSVEIKHPKRPERKPYVFEVEDVIQATNMTFQEGTILKSLIRSVVEREFGIGKEGGDYIRDAEKMVHSSQETLRARKIAKGTK